MAKLAVVLSVILVVLMVETNCQVKFIRPTYRPPQRPQKPVIRYAREAPEYDVMANDPVDDVTTGARHERSASNPYNNHEEPLWLYKGDDVIRAPSSADHPVLPNIIDDVKFGPTRHARSLGTPGRGRVGSNDRSNQGNRGHDTGATHPGSNRRNARSIHLPDFVTTPPFNPKPWPGFPKEKPRIPIYV